MAWLIASLSYTSPFATTGQWSVKGSVLGLMVTPRRAYAKGDLSWLLLPVLQSQWWAPANPHLHRRPSSTSRGLGQYPVESLLLSSGFWCRQDFVCALQDWSPCFPQSCVSPVIKSRWPSRSHSPGWEPWCGVQNLYNSGRTSLVLFSSLWITHLVVMGFYFIVIAPLLLSLCSFFFVCGCGISFDGFQYPPFNGCSTASCNFGVLTGEDEHPSFYSATLNWNYHIFIRSSGEDHLGCFHEWAIVSNAAVNINMQVSFWICILLDHMVILFLAFWGSTSILFSIVALPTYIPSNRVERSPFLHISSCICYLYGVFSSGDFDWCEVVPRNFNLHFSSN